MPIEIRELVIRATIDDGAEKEKGQGGKKPDDREALVAECVEQVMLILRRERER